VLFVLKHKIPEPKRLISGFALMLMSEVGSDEQLLWINVKVNCAATARLVLSPIRCCLPYGDIITSLLVHVPPDGWTQMG
jgi:hypothetical protein